MHKAFKNLFEGRAGFPTFRKKGQNDAFRYPDAKQIRIEEDRIFLPKAGLTEMVMHRPIVGTVKNVTVSVGRSWFASCNACDTVDAASRISRYRFVCTNCGSIFDADVNAAKNILKLGIISLTGGLPGMACESSRTTGRKQEEGAGKGGSSVLLCTDDTAIILRTDGPICSEA